MNSVACSVMRDCLQGFADAAIYIAAKKEIHAEEKLESGLLMVVSQQCRLLLFTYWFLKSVEKYSTNLLSFCTTPKSLSTFYF